MREVIYLATPYNDPNPDIMQLRFERVNKIAARLIHEGAYVYSPISQMHPVSECSNLPKGWEYWKGFDELTLSKCTKLVIYKQPGWDKSIGVKEEIKIAKKLNIPIAYIEFEDIIE